MWKYMNLIQVLGSHQFKFDVKEKNRFAKHLSK